ncbi:hypothetical protein SAMN05216337_1011159 [Bradyrhizobium brasilense]|uniref:Uncharacterized protein n=1 Tax=Bradyrhizobium brasilense TaxID=1419277 RepID=A0A1G6V3J8_9BRAD|nr:hypothetical protein SAMN05216337_1011159 [Bradyrhizobium brasilense]
MAQNVAVKCQFPGEIATPFVRLERREVAGITRERVQIGKETLVNQELSVALDDGDDVVQAIFGMILHAPE